MIEVKLLDGTTLPVYPSAAIVMDFEPTFGVSLEKVGSEEDLKSKSALQSMIEKFTWVLWRGNQSACLIKSEEQRFKKYQDLIELIGITELLKKGAEVLVSINSFASEQPEEVEDEKKKE